MRQGARTYWFLVGVGFLILGMLSLAVSERPRVAQAEIPSGERPGIPSGFSHPYIFLWIWEDNSPHAFKGYAVRQREYEAATYNVETGAATLYKSVTLTRETRVLVLTEASAGDTLLYSELHPVSALPWSHEIPELEWTGVYRAGPLKDQPDNMVRNENRFLRGAVDLLSVAENGAVRLRFDGGEITLSTGKGMPIVRVVDEEQGLYSRLILYNLGEWQMANVTLAFPPEEGR